MIDPVLFIQQTINFLILLYLLNRFLYRPVRKFLDDRSAAIETQLHQAEEDRAAAQQMREDLEQELAESRSKAREILDQAERRAEQMKEDLVKQARTESEQLRKQAREEIRREKDQAWATLKKDVVELSLAAASKVIEESMTEERHHRMAEQAVVELEAVQLGERL